VHPLPERAEGREAVEKRDHLTVQQHVPPQVSEPVELRECDRHVLLVA